jgi:hypothetical protein
MKALSRLYQGAIKALRALGTDAAVAGDLVLASTSGGGVRGKQVQHIHLVSHKEAVAGI